MALNPGTKLGPYEVVGPLGVGGMGEVYRARDTRLGRDVAIKILPKELSTDPARRQRFEREAKTISGLNHPNICVLHDVGNQDGVDYLVMECVEGESLAARLQKGPMPLEQVMRYGAQIADALDRAHRVGIVHRDLKPANVMLTSSGAKLLDFGLAKTVAPLGSGGLTLTAAIPTSPVTQEGMVVGTFQYMSPEQVEGKELDGRSDIFSLGTVLYEMLTGQRAFEGRTNLSVASAILEREPAPLSSLKPLTPPALERTIRKCLAKSPEERWQSASDLSSQLKWIAEAGTPSGSDAAVVPRKKSLVWAYAAGGAVAAAVLLTGLAIWGRKKAPEGLVVRLSITQSASQPVELDMGPMLTISADGQRIALQVADGGTPRLAIRELSAYQTRVLPGTEGGSLPFFSPDGQWLGFMAGGKLRKISVNGGAAIDLADVVNPIGGAWLRDGTIVFNPGWSGGLWRVPAAGGKVEPLPGRTAAESVAWEWYPQGLPSGDVLFSLRTGEGADESNVALYSMRTGKTKTLIEKGEYAQYSPSGHLVYLKGGALFAVPFDEKKGELTGGPLPVPLDVMRLESQIGYFAIADNGTLVYVPGDAVALHNTIVEIDRTGRETALGAPPRGYEDLALSPNGKQLALTVIGGQQWNIWVYDLEKATLNRVTFEGDNRDPLWSADGKRVIYSSKGNGRRGLYWKAVEGAGDEEQLVETEGQPFPGSTSRDGKYLAYYGGALGSMSDVFLLPLQGERKPKLLLKEKFSGSPAISPDGRWLAYESDESGRLEVYVRQLESGAGKRQVSTDGGNHPWWSPNMKELFFRGTAGRAETGAKLMSVSVTPGEGLSFSPPHVLFPFTCVQAGHDYDVTPDGQKFVCIKQPESETKTTRVNVVLNWTSELNGK